MLLSLRLRSAALLTFALVLLCAPVQAQVRIAPAGGDEVVEASGGADLERIVSTGDELELERRWSDALSHYEEALQQYPDHPELTRRLQLAKLHFDLGRRFADRSYSQSLGQMSDEEALAIYSEVLLKLQSHYVAEPHWKHLVDWGTSGLEVALTDPDFLSKNLPYMSGADIDAFRGQLRNWLSNQQIRDRFDARDVVAGAARMTEEHLRLPRPLVIMEYTCGATNSLDDYSAFLTSAQLGDVYSQIDGNFVGLGVELKSDQGALLIVNVIPASPAERSGIRGGDRIVKIDGQSTNEMSTDGAASLLQGPEGSSVRLILESATGERRDLAVRREHVEVPSVSDVKLLDPDRGIGYLKLTCFQKSTTRDVEAALWQLHRQGMKSLVMDLRGNPGGLLTTSVEVADKFIEQGSIVSTRGRNPNEDFNYTAHRQGTWRMPLVVLIDGDSASASEIFAGAIQDHRRGTIVGTRSYGKGSVQGIFPLAPVAKLPGAGLRLTTAKFYSPLGRAYAKIGVEPQVPVTVTARPINGQLPSAGTTEDDPFIATALGVARRQMARSPAGAPQG